MLQKEYYIALTGAKKNVGDYLITSRALKLLKHHGQNYDFKLLPNWKHLDNIELVNNSKGIIILGGPGYQQNLYPNVYKLRDNLAEIKVPIYILGGGWYGKPGDETTEKLYHFTKSSISMLKPIDETKAGLSCRDFQTKRVLERNGFKNVTMTGCPVWYDIPSLNKPLNKPDKIKRVVYTPAQHKRYNLQSKEVMDLIKEKFPEAIVYVSFHRGIGKVDEFTDESDAENTGDLSDYAKYHNFEVVDTSYDDSKIDFYNNCDIHIGYRVHAHIYFISKRKPSILLHEDGRGNGVTDALETPGIDAYKLSRSSTLFKLLPSNYYISKIYERLGVSINPTVIKELDRKLEEIFESDYKIFNKPINIIDENYRGMSKFIQNIFEN